MISGTVSQHEVSEAPHFPAFRAMENLRSMTLVECSSQLFVVVLQITEPGISCPPEDSFSTVKLVDLFATRKQCGVPLDSLILIAEDEHERIMDNTLGKFRRYVDDVEFRAVPQVPRWDDLSSWDI